LVEEIWSSFAKASDDKKYKETIMKAEWPTWDEKLVIDEEVEIVVQVNGKVRDKLTVPVEMAEEEIKNKALELENVKKWLDGKEPKKVIYVKGKLVSVVV